jgi:hypothetical protein
MVTQEEFNKELRKGERKGTISVRKETKNIERGMRKSVNKAINKTPISYKRQLSSNLMKSFSGGSQSSGQSRGTGKVGRPRGILKWKSPFSGQPVNAPQYYKELRAIRRIQNQKAQQIQIQQNEALARRGLTPQQLQQLNIQRQLQTQQIQAQRQMPQRIMPQNMPQQNISQPMPPNQQIQQQAGQVRPSTQPSIWNRQGYIAEERDSLGNIKQRVFGRPESFWN